MINYEVTGNKVRCIISGKQVKRLATERVTNVLIRVHGGHVQFNPHTTYINDSYAASATIRDGNVGQAKMVACRRAKLKLIKAIERKLKFIQTCVVAYHNALTLELIKTNDAVQHAEKLLDEVCE